MVEYSPADELLIEEKWQELVEACRTAKVCRREDDCETSILPCQGGT